MIIQSWILLTLRKLGCDFTNLYRDWKAEKVTLTLAHTSQNFYQNTSKPPPPLPHPDIMHQYLEKKNNLVK